MQPVTLKLTTNLPGASGGAGSFGEARMRWSELAGRCGARRAGVNAVVETHHRCIVLRGFLLHVDAAFDGQRAYDFTEANQDNFSNNSTRALRGPG